MNLRVFLSAIAALLFGSASAGPLHASQLGKDMAEADTKLNATYQRVLRGLPTDAAREKLKAAQRAWVAWREGEEALSASLYEDGKTGLFMQLELTQLRIKQLEAIGSRKTEYGYETK